MKVVIFTEGGKNIGLGHISRCSSLFDEIKSRGIEVELVIHGNLENTNLFEGRNVKNVNWLSGTYLNTYISKKDFCIVDSYLASEELLKIISNNSKKALFIDDNARVIYPKGVVVNPSINVDDLHYPEVDEIEYLLGAKYIILRPQFLNNKNKRSNEKVKEVLVTMGGSDVKEVTPEILKKICQMYLDIKFNVVIGSEFNMDSYKNICLKNVDFHYNINATEMKNLMLDSDFAITAAGQTIYELLAIQTPFIPIKVIDNQSNNIRGLKKINPELTVFDQEQEYIIEKLEKEFTAMLDIDYRKNQLIRYLDSVDDLGCKRIVDRFLGDY